MAIVDDIEARAATLGIDLSSLDYSSIHLPPGDDFGIISDDEEVYQEEQLDFEAGFGNIIVVDNLPVVPKEKFEKLEGVIRKIYGQIGVIKDDGLWMPVDPDSGKTLGYCFIEYNTPQVLSPTHSLFFNLRMSMSIQCVLNELILWVT